MPEPDAPQQPDDEGANGPIIALVITIIALAFAVLVVIPVMVL